MRFCVLRHTDACDYAWWNRAHDHHVLGKRYIKDNWLRCGNDPDDLDRALGDQRNLVPLCHRHHHRIEQGWDRPLLAEILRAKLPELVTFASEIGMLAGLERELRLYGLALDLEGSEHGERTPDTASQ